MNRNLALFRNKNFTYFFFAALLGVMGEGIYGLTAIVMVLEKTDSILEIGKLLVLTLLPSVILAPFIGVFIDRINKVKLAFACNILRFLVIAIIPISAFQGIFHVSIFFVSIFLSYILWFVLDPVKESILKTILSPDEYKHGISLVQGAWQLGLLSSAIIAGVLMDTLGKNAAILFASLIYVLAGIFFILVSTTDRSVTEEVKPKSTLRQYNNDLLSGWSYIYRNKTILYFGLTTSMVLPFIYAINTLIAPFNYQVLGGDGVSLGIIDSGAGIGSLIAAIVCTLWIKSQHNLRMILASIMLSTLFTVLFSLTISIPAAFVMYALIGMFLGIIRIMTRLVIFEHVEENFIGRVMTFISFVSLLLSIFMSLLISIIAEQNLILGYIVSSVFLLIPLVLLVRSARATQSSMKKECVVGES